MESHSFFLFCFQNCISFLFCCWKTKSKIKLPVKMQYKFLLAVSFNTSPLANPGCCFTRKTTFRITDLTNSFWRKGWIFVLLLVAFVVLYIYTAYIAYLLSRSHQTFGKHSNRHVRKAFVLSVMNSGIRKAGACVCYYC